MKSKSKTVEEHDVVLKNQNSFEKHKNARKHNYSA